jgi:hypothetical protein
MISARIIDNDMGRVSKVAPTGRGTIHGITMKIENAVLPEFDVGLLEILASDMSLSRFEAHVKDHIDNADHSRAFIEMYQKWATPINKSGKIRY